MAAPVEGGELAAAPVEGGASLFPALGCRVKGQCKQKKRKAKAQEEETRKTIKRLKHPLPGPSLPMDSTPENVRAFLVKHGMIGKSPPMAEPSAPSQPMDLSGDAMEDEPSDPPQTVELSGGKKDTVLPRPAAWEDAGCEFISANVQMPPKARGRKPKTQTGTKENADDQEDPEEEANQAEEPEKKRRRKKKVAGKRKRSQAVVVHEDEHDGSTPEDPAENRHGKTKGKSAKKSRKGGKNGTKEDAEKTEKGGKKSQEEKKTAQKTKKNEEKTEKGPRRKTEEETEKSPCKKTRSGPSAAQKAKASRKSSAYHVAKNAALRDGLDQEAAKAKGREVPWPHVCFLLF